MLLVSRRFLASDFIASTELPTLLDAADKNGLVIVWIAVGHSLYEHTQITDYQAANDPSKPLNSLSDSEVDRELVRVANILESLMSGSELSAGGRLALSEQSSSGDHQGTLLCKIVTEEAVAASDARLTQEQFDEAIERVSDAAPSDVDHTVSQVVNQLLNQVPEGETREQKLTPEHLRMREELAGGRWAWRSIYALAAKAGLDESSALAILRADPQVVLGRAKSGRAIAKMRSST